MEDGSSQLSPDNGELLYMQGENADRYYVVEDGLVELFLSGREGQKVVIDLCGTDEPFGVEEALAHSTYFTSARALEATTVRRIPASQLEELSRTNSEEWSQLLSHASFRRADLMDRCESVLHKNVARRLKCQLCKLAYKHGRRKGDAVVIDIRLTRRTMADLVGCREETVIRTLRQWEDEGLVTTHKSELTLLKPDDLFTFEKQRCESCFLSGMNGIHEGAWDPGQDCRAAS